MVVFGDKLFYKKLWHTDLNVMMNSLCIEKAGFDRIRRNEAAGREDAFTKNEFTIIM